MRHTLPAVRGLLRGGRLRSHEGDANHVGRTGRSERDTGDDDDALARFREAFVERDLAGALHHVVLVFRVLAHDAMYAPHDREAASSSCGDSVISAALCALAAENNSGWAKASRKAP